MALAAPALVMNNVEAVRHTLYEALENDPRTLILGDFAKVNAIMKELVPEPFPARSTIGVASLPLGASFEVEGIFAA